MKSRADAAQLPLGSQTTRAPNSGWIQAEPGFESAVAGTRIDVLHDAPQVSISCEDWRAFGVYAPRNMDPERPAWRIGEIEVSHGRFVAAFTILETAPGWTRLGPDGPAVVDLLRRARSLTLADARRAPDPPMRRDLYRSPWRSVPVPQSVVVDRIGQAQSAAARIADALRGPATGLAEATWSNLTRTIEGAAAAVAAGSAAPQLLIDGLLEGWQALGPIELHPDPWGTPLADTRREAMLRTFPLLARALDHPLFVGLDQDPPVRVDLATIWPIGIEWYKASPRLVELCPPAGDVLPAGTHLRQTGVGDPEFGDFWSILDGPLAGEFAVLCGALARPPVEWGLVSPEEPLVRDHDRANRLFCEIEAAWSSR